MMRHSFRDFFRRQRIAKHRKLYGDSFVFEGLQISLPSSVGIGVQNALLRGKYEVEEAAMIRRHLPAQFPVIELGGSLGVVSAFIRSLIGPSQQHIVVEANPAVAEICRANAERHANEGALQVVNAAVSYNSKTARFSLSRDLHTSSLAYDGDTRDSVEVPCITLREVHERLGAPEQFTLVCDIEGAEYQIFENDAETLKRVQIAIIELHPAAYALVGKTMSDLIGDWESIGLRVIDKIGDVVVFGR